VNSRREKLIFVSCGFYKSASACKRGQRPNGHRLHLMQMHSRHRVTVNIFRLNQFALLRQMALHKRARAAMARRQKK
jgi:hypothetical protein